ncbi:hypothetical protein FGG08_001659 [Glutinoglossum americanum]|uniref:Histidine kinase n=1 Tax=Glutinoglossum americanum TaxID=1670608 RepID=A0A9P8I6P4_9PEZI|nr:hypothetical protein FGG08_001659 [Glutinoglossum americanum]
MTRSTSPPPYLSMRNKDISRSIQDGRRGSLFVNVGGVSSLAEVALSALQYLPTPVLVLSSLKTVVLGNEAMGRLLGLDLAGVLDSVGLGDSGEPVAVTDVLRGQTLAQIGIDMLQDGRPVWVSWERFLDNLAEEMDKNGPAMADGREDQTDPFFQGGDTSPGEASEESHIDKSDPDVKSSRSELGSHKSTVHDAVIDVVLSSQYAHGDGSGTTSKTSSSDNQVQAKMIVSIWTLGYQRYYTLTFTNAAPDSLPNAHPQSRTVTRTPNSISISPPASASPSHSHCSHCTPPPLLTNKPLTPASLSTSPFPPMGAPARSNLSSTPSILQKVIRMKDAILETMELPVFAMWKDGSLAIPNQAGRRLLQQGKDPLTKHGYDLISRFRMWSEDFERELEPEEFPIVEICRTQKPFASRIVGMKDPISERNITYDVSGKGILDEGTGEFLAGLIWMRDVTEYKDRIATQREENEERFKTICDCMPQLLWTTRPDGHHDYFSKRWYEYTGLTEEESLGNGWKRPFHFDDVKIAEEKWVRSVATGEDYTTEYRCKRHDGVWRWMLGRALPLRDRKTGEVLKWYGTCTDIHDVVEARIAARRTREQLLNVIAHAQVTLWAVDRRRRLTLLEGRMIWNVNDVIDGSRSEAYLGKNIYEVFGHTDLLNPPDFLKPIEDIMKGRRAEDLEEHMIDGRWYRTRYVPILGKKIGERIDESKIDGVIGVSVDVTELKDRERELQSQGNENTRLLANEAAAKEASRLKSQFLANMSHEIRTPIAGVIGMAELLLDTKLDYDQQECAENIQRSANALLTVINDILDFSKVESGRLDIEEVQFSLPVVIRDVSKMLGFAAERKSLAFESDVQIGIDKEQIVIGDPGRVRQILTNLLTNSIKFTSDGGVRLAVMVQSEDSETIEVKFVIEDTGIGIEDDVRKRLFKPFSQADSSTARRFGGTGLGLTICKNLVELMNGTINLESTLGIGTRASFSIPFHKPQFHNGTTSLVDISCLPDRLQSEMSVSCNSSDLEPSGVGTPPETPANTLGQETSANGSTPAQAFGGGRSSRGLSSVDNDLGLPFAERGKIHILVVEDNPINQQIALKTIKKLHFSVSAVWNGKEALDYLLRSQSPGYIRPDVILMDVQMPVIDGYRATHLIRNIPPYSTLPELRKIPIVAMTASAIQGDREKCRKAGMDDYLSKPVKGKILEKMLVKWVLEKKKGDAGKSHSIRSHGSSFDTEPDGPTLSEVGIDADERTHQQNDESLMMKMAARSGISRVIVPDAALGLRRVETEDMATLLRDDKLLAAAAFDVHDTPNRTLMTHSSNPVPPTQQSLAALTEENIEKLHEQNESINEAERTPGATSLTVSGHPSTESFVSLRPRLAPGHHSE